MKRPDEIKKGLESDALECIHQLEAENEAYKHAARKCCYESRCNAQIKELETLGRRLMDEKKQLERERDALLKDIGSAQGCICIICKNYNNPDPGKGTAECNILGRFKDCGSDGALMCGQFKWRGVKEG
jgi:hypothetical protein